MTDKLCFSLNTNVFWAVFWCANCCEADQVERTFRVRQGGDIGVSKKGRANHFKHNIMAKLDEALGALCGSAPCLIAF